MTLKNNNYKLVTDEDGENDKPRSSSRENRIREELRKTSKEVTDEEIDRLCSGK